MKKGNYALFAALIVSKLIIPYPISAQVIYEYQLTLHPIQLKSEDGGATFSATDPESSSMDIFWDATQKIFDQAKIKLKLNDKSVLESDTYSNVTTLTGQSNSASDMWDAPHPIFGGGTPPENFARDDTAGVFDIWFVNTIKDGSNTSIAGYASTGSDDGIVISHATVTGGYISVIAHEIVHNLVKSSSHIGTTKHLMYGTALIPPNGLDDIAPDGGDYFFLNDSGTFSISNIQSSSLLVAVPEPAAWSGIFAGILALFALTRKLTTSTRN